MGSVTKKIIKKAKRFHNYLSIIEKHLKAEQEKAKELPLVRSFDLAQTVEAEMAQTDENKRKMRNKRKAKRKELRNN